MSIKDAFNPLFSLTARACERSGTLARIIRNVDFKGKGRIVERIRSDAMAREVTAWCDGVQLRLELRDDVQREIYFNVFEKAELRQALNRIPVGGVCLDIGANNGVFALQFAKKVGAQGLVHAFEPDKNAFSRLEANTRLNRVEHVLKCHNLAVSNMNGALTFYESSPHHSGWGSLEEFRDIAVNKETVQAITLDDFLGRENVRNVDFLKVDVEAHEPEVLEGAGDSLRKQVFRNILIEFNGIRLSQRGKVLEDFLKPILDNGYSAINFRNPELEELRNRTIAPEAVCTTLMFTARHRS
jgi:FkbM family methyltransferase